MKRQDEFGLGSSIFITIIFAIMAISTYQSDNKDGNPLAWIPGVVVVIGIIMTIIASVKASNDHAKEVQQQSVAKAIKHDSSIGNNDLKLYIDSSSSTVTISATTANGSGSKQDEIQGFVCSKAVETDSYIVAVDYINHQILKVRNDNGDISKTIFDIDEELSKLGIIIVESSPALNAYNNYAFITDDKNEFVVIVKPESLHVIRYSDIVSISYEENGNDVYNKSLGGAVAGGLLFGGVGAIVGGSTAKTTKNKEVNSMAIKILLKSTSNPTIVLKIYEGFTLKTQEGFNRVFYEGLMKEVEGIKDIFSIIIDIKDKHNSKYASSHSVSMGSTSSVADELIKLTKLKDAGVLSEEEFNAQKMKILNQSGAVLDKS